MKPLSNIKFREPKYNTWGVFYLGGGKSSMKLQKNVMEASEYDFKQHITATYILATFIEFKGKYGPWRGLRDMIREVTALIMHACSQNDCVILYWVGVMCTYQKN